MRAIEHVYPDGSSSFEYTDLTHGEYRMLRAMEAATSDQKARVEWIRNNCSIDHVHIVDVMPEPPDDAHLIPPRPLR